MAVTPESPNPNPLGIDGFEFVEFTSPEPERMAETDSFAQTLFASLVEAARKRSQA